MTSEKRIFNKSFNAGVDGLRHLNACVGENGFVDKRTYSNGFAEAVDILTSAVEASDERANIDTLIYPICFCVRHHVELFLKAQIETITAMRAIPLAIALSSTHDLGNLWTAFADLAKATDRRFNIPVHDMEEFIRDIAQIDPTGQTFRYPSDIESAKHLVATPVINIHALRSRFMNLAEKIAKFESLSDTLEYEYRHGKFTKKLSRADLEYIARSLPSHDTWGTSIRFTDAKASLMTHFGISGGEFSRALCTIKEHAEFSSYIGISIPIVGLSISTIDNLNLVFSGELKVMDWARDELVAIESAYEISRPIYLSEEFENIRKHVAFDFDSEAYTDGMLAQRARTLKRLIKGLRKIGQTALAEYAELNLTGAPAIARIEAENEEFRQRYPW